MNMAMSTYESTPETTNANRISRIFLGPCTDQLRDVLRHRVRPSKFHYVIIRNRSNLPRLSQSQKDLILPRTGPYSGDYSDMDMSLLYILLRNISNIQPHTNDWGNIPDIRDYSLSASIDRIRDARNRVFHSSSTALTQTEFDGILSEIKIAVISMDSYLGNNNKYETAVDFLLTETMDPEQELFMLQLRKQVEEDEATKEGVSRLEGFLKGQQEDMRRLQSLQEKSQRQQNIHSADISLLQSQQQESERQQTTLSKTVQTHSDCITALQTQQQESQKQQTSLTENVQNHSEYIASLQNQQEESQRQQIAPTEQIQTISEALASLHTQQQDFQRQLFTLTKSIQILSDNVASLQTLHQELHREVVTLTKSIQTFSADEDSLQLQRTGLDCILYKHDDQIDAMRRNILHMYSRQDSESDVSKLKGKLIEMNYEETREIPLSAVTTDSDILPIEHLFSSVVIREDVNENRKQKKSARRGEQQEEIEVKSPDDMLTKNGKPVPRVFMLGKAAHGKTTYCKWFLKTWCNTQQPGMSGRTLNKWENALSQFDFVFHIPFRHVDPSRANVTDMICKDILGSHTDLQVTAKHVLSSDTYRCLIMMDGLDKWKPDHSVIDRLKYRGMPDTDSMSNCVIFTTMRPWKFSVIQGVRSDDRVIEIQGLDDKGIESVIEKVLVHYYEMIPGTVEYEATYERIIKKLKNKTMKSFMKIPLLAVVCVQIWYGGEQAGDSMTSFYIAMVNMLIKRAHLKYDTQELSFESINVILPKQMSTKKNIKNYTNVLLKLGKVAYEGLLSKEMKLVFQKDDLETEIGERELQFALDVGLISQRDVHSVMEEKVSVHFFHKSVQEFLAAIYIVNDKEVSDLFCKHLCDIKVIMELSNVIMFVCGMCPCLGSVISQRVVSVTDSDTGICKYRESPGDNITVKELYEVQVSWYRELEYGQIDSAMTDSLMPDCPVTFHVSDVYQTNDIETVRVTREILTDHHVDIRSLRLNKVPTDGVYGITNTIVNEFLCNTNQTRTLTGIYINGYAIDRTVSMISGPSLMTLYLRSVTVPDTKTIPAPVLCDCDMLQVLVLDNVTLGDRDLGLTSSMTLLQMIELDRVKMTELGWGRWLQSVIDIHHQFLVLLIDTNIDRHTRSSIHSSPHLSITQDGPYRMAFTRVWPQTQDIYIDRQTEPTINSSSQLNTEEDRLTCTGVRTQTHDSRCCILL